MVLPSSFENRPLLYPVGATFFSHGQGEGQKEKGKEMRKNGRNKHSTSYLLVGEWGIIHLKLFHGKGKMSVSRHIFTPQISLYPLYSPFNPMTKGRGKRRGDADERR